MNSLPLTGVVMLGMAVSLFCAARAAQMPRKPKPTRRLTGWQLKGILK